MKILIKQSILVAFFLQLFAIPQVHCQGKKSGQISISGAFALYPMVIRWTEEYKKINPGIRFDISAGGAGKGISDALYGMVEIGMVSREIYNEEIKKGAFPIAVTRDAVVAIISDLNPALNEILSKGLKQDVAGSLWINGSYTTWSEAFGTKLRTPINIYTRSDACGAAEIWAKFFGKKQEDLLGVGVFGDPGLAQAIRKDPLGIGYSNIGYVYDAGSGNMNKGLKVVPIDLNNNGYVDNEEKFYDSMESLVAAIGAGKYPSPPARDLYFVTKGNPRNNKVLADFIKWVLTDGQKYVGEAGFIALSEDKIKSEIEKLK